MQNEPNTDVAILEPQKPLIQQMLESAKDIDVEKLKVLQEMHYRDQDRAAERSYAEDFIRMKAKLPKIVRLKKNTQTNSKYAPLEDINTSIDHILEEFGFGTMHKIIETNAEGVKVNVRLWHKGGHFEEIPVWMPIDDKGMQGTKNKTLPHGIASAVMYARRVGECSLLNISTGDDDGNYTSITPEKAKEIEERLTKCGADKVKFLEFMSVETVDEIQTSQLSKAENMIKAKERANAKKHK